MSKAKASHQKYSRKLKGLEPVISTLLIIGVLAAASFTAYEWGMPIMQKNVDKTQLYSAETFTSMLDKKIDDVARNGGSDEVIFNIPGQLVINPTEDKIEFTVESSGSLYSPGGFVCFSENCDLKKGVWGTDSYSVIGSEVALADQGYSFTRYSIIFRNLTSGSATIGNQIYVRDIVTPSNTILTGSEGAKILITKVGEERGNPIKTIIKIDLL